MVATEVVPAGFGVVGVTNLIEGGGDVVVLGPFLKEKIICHLKPAMQPRPYLVGTDRSFFLTIRARFGLAVEYPSWM